MTLNNLFSILKGSFRSGNRGHAGRIGHRGGSAPKSSGVQGDADGDGVTDAARVGVNAHEVPPPPPVPRLPNLTPIERQAESDFINAYEKDPDGMAKNLLEVIKKSTKEGEPLTFGTDDAKVLVDKWSDPPPETRAHNRATLNAPLHQTANAVTKRAFLQHLDTLKPGDEVLVTVGGCGSGKGYALNNIPDALKMKKQAKAVWDSAGDQNATENPWIQKELEKRGLKGSYVYVHANPKIQWADPQRGVVKRAADPKDGRMVDAKIFADSYSVGAKNHQAFYQANKTNPNAKFVFLDNTGQPRQLKRIPPYALVINSKDLAKFAVAELDNLDVPGYIKQGATIGERIWAND